MDSSIFESCQNHCSKQGFLSKIKQNDNNVDLDETAHYEYARKALHFLQNILFVGWAERVHHSVGTVSRQQTDHIFIILFPSRKHTFIILTP